MSRIIKIISSQDGQKIAGQIREHFAGIEEVQIHDHRISVPEASEWTVVVFILTEQSIHAQTLRDSLEQCIKQGFPVIPVVYHLEQYDFAALPDELASLKELNVLGWIASDPARADGEQVCETLKVRLGMSLFHRDRKLFISYCRSDGQAAAKAIHDYFKGKGYRPFLDIIDIEGGDEVQRFIKESIAERDFLLFIETPNAMHSQWIQKEIRYAMENGIKILALREASVGDRHGYSLPAGVKPIMYQNSESIAGLLPEIEQAVAKDIARKVHFDDKIDKLLYKTARLKKLQLTVREKRLVMLTQTTSDEEKYYLVAFEDAPYSLERLYRLHQHFERVRPKVSQALFIYNGSPLLSYQKEAVQWAKQHEPLEFVVAEEFMGVFPPTR